VTEDDLAKVSARRVRLAGRRKALGLTQEELAELLDVDRKTVARWEAGKAQPLPWLRPKLARALKASPERIEALLDGAGAAGPPGPGVATLVPRQLPAVVADFTGRAAELAGLTRILDQASAGAAGTVVISAIGGTAGVGKTALALQWTHQVAGRFADGQLYVNLRGFDPSGTPATPAEAIRRFLDALGVPPERIPSDPEAQTALYRSLLAGRRMLIVLDNARDEQQVRPLLPASAGSLVLVTSRKQLAGLTAADGARLLSLDVLAHEEAVRLLAARIGHTRAAAEPEAVAEIAGLCACLPLALAVAAARAAARPGFRLAALASELRDAGSRLEALNAGDQAASVQAVLSWSYHQLSSEAARMFRLLGLHPGPDISVPAAASLAATTSPEARRLLDELTRDCLITEHVPGRYAFHDLLRAYAAVRARDADSEDDRAAATARLLDHYLHSAGHGARLLEPTDEPVSLPPPAPGTTPERPADHRGALAWFDAEYLVLRAAVGLAAESGFDGHAWRLPWAMTPYLEARGIYQQWADAGRAALTAATRLGDLHGQAVSARQLACALIEGGDYDLADSCFRQSLRLYQRLGNQFGEAEVHANLGYLAEKQSRPADGLRHAEEAFRLFLAVGHTAGVAEALSDIGWFHGQLGDHEQARGFCLRALALLGGVGYHWREADVLVSLGYAEQHLGNFGEAIACYERALGMFREFGARYDEADALMFLGDTRHAAGDLPRAREAWRQALSILDELQHPQADEVRAKLAGTDGPGGLPSD
jgi:tetratricopeptide (TPR) repeat protein/transcriptional regulator with XRE-family HTH domain